MTRRFSHHARQLSRLLNKPAERVNLMHVRRPQSNLRYIILAITLVSLFGLLGSLRAQDVTPTDTPTDVPPTLAPTDAPTEPPTVAPTDVPTQEPPTLAPTDVPTQEPPTAAPTDVASTDTPTQDVTSDVTETPTL